jgi:hypothetical protein
MTGPLTFDFTLERSSSISGTITDQHGAPAAGVIVQTCPNTSSGAPSLCPGASTMSDAAGAFRLANLPHGTYHLYLSGAGYVSVSDAVGTLGITGPGQDLVVAPFDHP